LGENLLKKLKNILSGFKKIDYDEAKKLANHEDASVRLNLARRSDTVPEILYFLAEDPSPEVRLAIAKNLNSPYQADLLLSRDGNTDVRTGLAEKISKLVPGLSGNQLDKVHKAATEVLKQLARDEAIKVRQVLSETLKDVANAPAEIINRLARDVDWVVCAPVLEHSPVLNEDDLLEIINSKPVEGALSAISARKGVSESITDAIYDSDDVGAIGVMLANKSAQIREDTLDKIITRSVTVEQWHAPLVERPKLSQAAALRLADYVSDNLLEQLEGRGDLSPEMIGAVRKEFSRRMGKAEGEVKAKLSPEERAGKLFADGKLTDSEISDACHSGDVEFVKKSLVLKSKLGFAVVEQILEMASPKSVLALCWKARLDIKTAVLVQKRIARIPPSEVQGGSGGKYPYTDDEMEWQLDFIKNPK